MRDPNAEVLDALQRNLHSAWDGDIETYRATTAEDVSFFEWFCSPQRIDGIEFHLRELAMDAAVTEATGQPPARFDLEMLNTRVQLFGETAIVSYMLLIRTAGAGCVERKASNETRVFHNFGTADAPAWKLVHCHKSPLVTPASMGLLQL